MHVRVRHTSPVTWNQCLLLTWQANSSILASVTILGLDVDDHGIRQLENKHPDTRAGIEASLARTTVLRGGRRDRVQL